MINESVNEVSVLFGVGEEYPGEIVTKLSFTTGEAIFCSSCRNAYSDCVKRVEKTSEDTFVWISIIDSEGNSLFEIEDQLIEWLEEEVESAQ